MSAIDLIILGSLCQSPKSAYDHVHNYAGGERGL